MNDRPNLVGKEEPEEPTLAQIALEQAINSPTFDAEMFHEAWEARLREITTEIKEKLANIKVGSFDTDAIRDAARMYWDGIDEEEKAAKAEVMDELKRQTSPRGLIFNTIWVGSSIWLYKEMKRRGLHPVLRILALLAVNDLVAYIQDPERTRVAYEEIKLRARALRHG